MLQQKVKFTSFSCTDYKKAILKAFKEVCVQNYTFATLTYINRIFRGQFVPKVTDKLCLLLKLAYQCYLKTILKNKRPNAIDSVKAKAQEQSEVSKKYKKADSKSDATKRKGHIELKEVQLHIVEASVSGFGDLEEIFIEDFPDNFFIPPNSCSLVISSTGTD